MSKMTSEENTEQNDMRPEYDFSGGVRGKHYQAYRQGHTVKIHQSDGNVMVQHFTLEDGVVFLEPDVREYFPDSDAVNNALRGLIAFPDNPSDDTSLNDMLKNIFGDQLPDKLPEGTENKTLAEFFEINHLEADLNLPNGFFVKLLDEDDWSFVIKLHTLIEAAVTLLLLKYFNKPELDPVFSYLALGNAQTGKLVFAKSLNLIDKDTIKFIKRLSAIRNKYAHKVTYVNMQIKDFLDDLNQNARNDYRQELLFGYQPKRKIQIKHDKESYSAKAIMQLFSAAVFDYVPKLSIWFGSIICLSSIYNHIALAEIRVQKQELDEQIGELLETLIQPSQNLNEEQEAGGEGE